MLGVVNLGDRIRAARHAAGLDQQELARRVHHGVRAVAYWESGARIPRLATLVELERVLATRLREPDDDSPRLRSSSDASLLVEFSQRLDARDEQIRDLTGLLDTRNDDIRALTAQVDALRAQLEDAGGTVVPLPSKEHRIAARPHHHDDDDDGDSP